MFAADFQLSRLRYFFIFRLIEIPAYYTCIHCPLIIHSAITLSEDFSPFIICY